MKVLAFEVHPLIDLEAHVKTSRKCDIYWVPAEKIKHKELAYAMTSSEFADFLDEYAQKYWSKFRTIIQAEPNGKITNVPKPYLEDFLRYLQQLFDRVDLYYQRELVESVNA